MCEKVFQEEGISADVSIGEFPLEFVPFDSDLLSLELDGAYKVTGYLGSRGPDISGLSSIKRCFQRQPSCL